MSLEGEFFSRRIDGLMLHCKWSGSQNVGENCTDILLEAYLNLSSEITSELKAKLIKTRIGISIDDNKPETYGIKLTPDASLGEYLLCSKNIRVDHDIDGKKTFKLFVTWDLHMANMVTNRILASETVVLNTIDRASKMTSILNPFTPYIIGIPISIKWKPLSTDFKYKVKFLNVDSNWSYTSDYIAPNTIDTYEYEYKIPDDLVEYLPNNEVGSMVVELYTYYNSVKIGETSRQNFRVKVPFSFRPTIDEDTFHWEANNDSHPIINDWYKKEGIFGIAGYTTVKFHVEASGSGGSTIKYFKIDGTFNETLPAIQSQTDKDKYYLDYEQKNILAGDKVFEITAIDSRGRVSDKKTLSIHFESYSPTEITIFSADRIKNDEQKVQIYASCAFLDIYENNKITYRLFYKCSDEDEWKQYDDPEISCFNFPTSEASINKTIKEFDERLSYNLKLQVEDSLGSISEYITFIPPAHVLLDFKAGGKGLGIGQIAEGDRMEVAINSLFIGDVYIRVVTSNGESVDVLLKDYIKNVINGTIK